MSKLTKRRLSPGAKKFLIQLEPEQIEKLKLFAERNHVNISEAVRKLIINHTSENI